MHTGPTDQDINRLVSVAERALRGEPGASTELQNWITGHTTPSITDSSMSLATTVLKLLDVLQDREITLQSTAEQLSAQNSGLRSALESAKEREREISDLYEVANAITAKLNRDDLVLVLEEKTKSLIDADVCSLVLHDLRHGGLQIIGPGLQLARRMPTPEHLDVCEQVSMAAATTGEARYVSNVTNCQHCRFRRLASEDGVHHMLSVPLRVQDRVLGAINTFRINKHPFDHADERKLRIIASAAAVALENAEAYRREQDIADKLQRGIQPGRLFELPGFTVGCDYRTTGGLTKVGGDFYDIVNLGEGRFGVVMADIAGKGIDAAVHAAKVRFTHRGLMLADPDPTAVLHKLNNAVLSFVPDETFVTLFYGVLDTNTRTLTYGNAGHDYPIYYDSTLNLCSECDVTGRAIGMMSDEIYAIRRIEFAPGDLIALYTDGITEARRGNKFFGFDRLLQVIAENAVSNPKEIVNAIFGAVDEFAGGTLKDDAGVLVIKAN